MPGGSLADYHARLAEADGRRSTFTPLSMINDLLPTPRTTDSHGGGRHGTGGPDLRTTINDLLLPTPTTMDGHGSRRATARTTAWKSNPGTTLTDAVWMEDAWGKYATAISRWEHTTGRPAPSPRDDEGRLSPQFTEWMMGLPEGWVTDLIGPRVHTFRLLGNGVVPQQALLALSLLTNIKENQ